MTYHQYGSLETNETCRGRESIEAELEQFKHRLVRLRAELQNLEESSKEATRPAEPDQAASGRLSRMAAMQAQLTAGEPARRHQRQLGKIEGTLRRNEAGDYGMLSVRRRNR
jgi:DnaK suppressor protein